MKKERNGNCPQTDTFVDIMDKLISGDDDEVFKMALNFRLADIDQKLWQKEEYDKAIVEYTRIRDKTLTYQMGGEDVRSKILALPIAIVENHLSKCLIEKGRFEEADHLLTAAAERCQENGEQIYSLTCNYARGVNLLGMACGVDSDNAAIGILVTRMVSLQQLTDKIHDGWDPKITSRKQRHEYATLDTHLQNILGAIYTELAQRTDEPYKYTKKAKNSFDKSLEILARAIDEKVFNSTDIDTEKMRVMVESNLAYVSLIEAQSMISGEKAPINQEEICDLLDQAKKVFDKLFEEMPNDDRLNKVFKSELLSRYSLVLFLVAAAKNKNLTTVSSMFEDLGLKGEDAFLAATELLSDAERKAEDYGDRQQVANIRKRYENTKNNDINTVWQAQTTSKISMI